MNEYPKYLQDIIIEFSKLPGIGYKTAVRLSMNVINKNIEDVLKFSSSARSIELQSDFIGNSIG